MKSLGKVLKKAYSLKKFEIQLTDCKNVEDRGFLKILDKLMLNKKMQLEKAKFLIKGTGVTNLIFETLT